MNQRRMQLIGEANGVNCYFKLERLLNINEVIFCVTRDGHPEIFEFKDGEIILDRAPVVASAMHAHTANLKEE